MASQQVSETGRRVEQLMKKLIAVKDDKPGTEVYLLEDDLMWVARTARDVFMSQPMLLEVGVPINICGDTHGQYHDLLRLFEMGGFPPAGNYLFLGDYVDRAKQSIETITLLLCYKIRYPETFFLLRGNHECSALNRIYGFFDECKRRYSVKLWRIFGDCFNCMPVTAIVADKIICMHGGLSPDLDDLTQISQMERPVEVPEDGLLCDLVWSDPDPHIVGWGYNSRGVSYTFGPDVIRDFLRTHDLDLVCRAHQVVEDGYEFQAHRSLVTVFSAPNYCGEFDNAGGIMVVNADLVCSFKILRPVLPKPDDDSEDDDEPSLAANGETAAAEEAGGEAENSSHSSSNGTSSSSSSSPKAEPSPSSVAKKKATPKNNNNKNSDQVPSRVPAAEEHRTGAKKRPPNNEKNLEMTSSAEARHLSV